MDNPKIYPAIAAIISDIGAVGKNQKNQQQNFKYRGIDDIMNALQPLLSKHKVFSVPQILDQKREERQSKNGSVLIYSICTIKYTFYAEDGSFVEAVVIGEGMDSGDKATNKAMSIAFKYACFQVFCIPTEEMPDPDAETPPPSTPKGGAQTPPPPRGGGSGSSIPSDAPTSKPEFIAKEDARALLKMARTKWVAANGVSLPDTDLSLLFDAVTGFVGPSSVPASALDITMRAMMDAPTGNNALLMLQKIKEQIAEVESGPAGFTNTINTGLQPGVARSGDSEAGK
ncbi:MAG: ERF family protein [Oscillospiraceae bacterium]|jgi:hypothetical protein|nr:ERF family protein [Oscillospiraceae bacterium]